MSEQVVQQTILLRLARGAVRLFRNNVGTAWTGRAMRITRAGIVRVGPKGVPYSVEPGDIVIRNPRPLHAGLCRGSSDLIGLRSVTVTPEMVGQRLAVFAAVEVKAPRGRLTAEQEAFIAMVREMGGLAGAARSVEDAEGLLGLR
jgi:hypothetical protein